MRRVTALVPVLLLCACGRSADQLVTRAEEQMQAERTAEAILTFRKALQKDARLGRAHYGLGLAYYKTGDLAGAYQSLTQAVELTPEDPQAVAKLAEVAMGALLVDQRRPEHLKKHLQALTAQMLRRDPRSPEAHKLEGLLATVEENHEKALASFRLANAVPPLDPGRKLLEIQALFQTDRRAEGENEVRALIQSRPQFGPAYDVLIARFLNERRTADAEAVLRAKVEANPDSTAYQIQLARFYTERGNRPAAESTLKATLSSQSAEKDSFLRVGDFYVATGELDNALQLYRQGLKGDSSIRQKSHVRIAATLGMQQKYEEAVNAVREARKLSMHDEEVVRLEADLLAYTGKPENVDLAIRIYKELLVRKPGDPFIRYNLSRTLAKKGDAAAARRELEDCIRFAPNYLPAINALSAMYRASGQTRDLLVLADKVLADEPANVGAKLLRAEGLLRTGRPGDARTLLQTLQQHPVVGRDVSLLLARVHAAEKNFERAEIEFRKQHVTGTVDLRALQGLSDVLLLQGKISSVTTLWQQEASRTPASLPVKRGLAKALYLGKQYEAATALFRDVLAGTPDDVESGVFMAASLFSLGRRDEGMQAFRNVSNMPGVNGAAIDGIIADLLQFEGNTPLADEYYRKVLEKDPNNAVALNNLAYSLALNGSNREEAMKMAQRAVQVQPNNAEFADTLAFVLLQTGKIKEAEAQLSTLVLRFPQHPAFRYHYALALMRTGQHENARKELSFALPRADSPELARKIQTALKDLRAGARGSNL